MRYSSVILDILIGNSLFLSSSILISRWCFLFRTEWTDCGNHFLPRMVGIPQEFIFWLIFR